jgi:hypothetical protein
MAEKVDEDPGMKARPRVLWPTPVITVEEEDEDMPTTILPGSRRTSSTSKPFLPLPGHEDDEPSSGVSDQGGNSDYDGESTFSPSPTGSFKGSNEYLGYRRSSSTLQSDDDYIDEDLTPSPTSPYRETKRNGSPTRMGNTLSPVRLPSLWRQNRSEYFVFVMYFVVVISSTVECGKEGGQRVVTLLSSVPKEVSLGPASGPPRYVCALCAIASCVLSHSEPLLFIAMETIPGCAGICFHIDFI